VGFSPERFAALEQEIRAHLLVLGVTPAKVIPIAAREGVNVAGRDDAPATPWWTGGSLLQALEGLEPATAPSDKPLRLPIQDVYKFDERRIFAGRIEAGALQAGDALIFQPSGKTARVARIESWPKPWPEGVAAPAGRSVGITLDKPLFLERGEVAGPVEAPPQAADRIKASVFWLGQASLSVGEAVTLKLGAAETAAVVEKIEKTIDTSTLAEADSAAVLRGQAAQVSFTLKRKLGVDVFAEQPRTGRFVLERGGVIVGGGLVTGAEAITRYVIPAKSGVSFAERAKRNGHRGGVLWLTGLSGSGKSTIAAAVERALFDRGWSVARLDGDDLRLGLNRDLSFTTTDRSENIRRAAEVAALLARAGMVVITPLISPLREDRARAREIVGKHFLEVFVSTALEVCEQRDPKGLYAKARAGQIAEFTGVSAPYEAPLAPELAVDAGVLSPEEAATRVIEHAQLAFSMDAGEPVWP
jgi:bifunctional enzyme CysN/CysC